MTVFVYFYTFLANTERRDLCCCVICGDKKVKRDACRLFEWDEFESSTSREELTLIFGDRCTEQDVVIYICKRCDRDIKNCGKKSTKELINVTSFVCTCCHLESEDAKKYVGFVKKRYDFRNPVVLQAFSYEFRKKNSMNERVCKSCHKDLSNKNGPAMPRNAACLRMPVSNYSQVKRNLIERQKWSRILDSFGQCGTFQELERVVKNTKLPATSNVAFNYQLNTDSRDGFATDLYPNDGPLPRNIVFPIRTSADGSCFYNAISRLCYGNEKHALELRVRTIHDAVMHKKNYLCHDYLCRGLDNHPPDHTHLADTYKMYGADEFQRLDREEFYEHEVMSLRKRDTYSGIWQIHQMANVLKCGIWSVFPERASDSLRKDFHRLILPGNVVNNPLNFIVVMWTKSSAASWYNHFVPIVR